MKIDWKDENEWSDVQERNIALRKSRAMYFWLMLIFVVFVVSTIFNCYAILNNKGDNIFMFINIALIPILLFLLLRYKYLTYKYKS